MNIVFLDAKTVGDVPNLKSLEEFGNVTYYPVTKPEETKARIQNADIVITNKVVLDRSLLKGASQLKLICIAATGMNNVDLEAAKMLGIPVKNVSGYSTKSVTQCTFAMIFHLIQQLNYYDEYVKSGDYSKSEIFTNQDRSFFELSGKRIGIIGLGQIGRSVAALAEAFGAEVVYYSTSGKNNDQPYTQLDLNGLLTTSEIVSIHAPLNEDTRNLIGANELSIMKSSALLINTGRGGIVDENALSQAIDSDQIAGAGIDVFENEPMKSVNPLLQISKKEKLVLTPHIAWASVEARTELIDGVMKNIREFIA